MDFLDNLLSKKTHIGVQGINFDAKAKREILTVKSPIDRKVLGEVQTATKEDYEAIVKVGENSFVTWREVPAPKRGEIVRQIGEELRKNKKALGKLVSLEVGKILAEGEGEIQEAIDIAEFAVGLSRQLYGKTIQSERFNHKMFETWHPLGVVGVITAFNFPAAVWAWNSMLAAVCGDTIIWKPSEYAPLTAIAMNEIANSVAEKNGYKGIFNLAVGKDKEIGELIAKDKRIPLVSATGSTPMGRSVAKNVAERLGRSLLELGGNNAVIILKDADLKMAIRSTVFGSVGTAGQRCTTTRRLFIEEPIFNDVVNGLVAAYKQVKIGDPLTEGVLMGPLINEQAVGNFEKAITHAKEQGGEIVYGGNVKQGLSSSLYVEPTIIKVKDQIPVMKDETFAPILYVMPVKDFNSGMELHNNVPQGLSSAIFTGSVQSSQKFLSAGGSDCGIANVNLGTSGAEIGGAFGGEKDTGGGRESGSDSWQVYMRRQTSTVNYGNDLPLAQGIKFDIE